MRVLKLEEMLNVSGGCGRRQSAKRSGCGGKSSGKSSGKGCHKSSGKDSGKDSGKGSGCTPPPVNSVP
ncbi:hypothetical protein [Hydrogenophaga sp. MI9]|uniref:hypothetical protein n=1 Tax=Hydrogenophaga sp. MI9 TaxID=3453719 RepID=UPI003EF05E89